MPSPTLECHVFWGTVSHLRRPFPAAEYWLIPWHCCGQTRGQPCHLLSAQAQEGAVSVGRSCTLHNGGCGFPTGLGQSASSLMLTLSQSTFSTSTRIRMSSGMARAGWVSFSWMATCSITGVPSLPLPVQGAWGPLLRTGGPRFCHCSLQCPQKICLPRGTGQPSQSQAWLLYRPSCPVSLPVPKPEEETPPSLEVSVFPL